MSLINWIQNFRSSLHRKQHDRLAANRTVVISQVEKSTPGPRPAAPRASSGPLFPATARQELAVIRSHHGAASDVGITRTERESISEPAPIRHLADVPSEISEQIELDSLLRIARRLEMPLRALYTATSRHGRGLPPDELRRFLLIWRQALGDYMDLVPDERSTLTYDRSIAEAYFVRGYCEPGARLAVLDPCWTLHGRVAVRGEARVIEEARP